MIIASHDGEIIVRERAGRKSITINAIKNHGAEYSFGSPQQLDQDYKIEDLVRGIREFVPSSSAVAAEKANADAVKIKTIVEEDDYVYCSK